MFTTLKCIMSKITVLYTYLFICLQKNIYYEDFTFNLFLVKNAEIAYKTFATNRDTNVFS